VAWRTGRNAPFVPSALVLDDLYYLVDDSGIAACFEAATGKVLWQQRLGGAFTASPIAAGERIYFVDEDGRTTIIRAGRKFEVLAKNSIGEPVFSSPAIGHGDLFLRSDRHLFCINGSQVPQTSGE
jgi:outer membrane protein assembly factor BamB